MAGWYNRLSKRKKVFLWIGAVFVGLIVIGGVFGEEPEPDVAPAQAVTTPLTQIREPASSPTTAPTATPTPTPTEEPPTIREQVEDCLDPWDGNHTGFEDQIRPLLNDRGSMETHETRFGIEDHSLNRVVIGMGYSAKNAFGGRVSMEAIGLLDYTTCKVEVLSTGLE